MATTAATGQRRRYRSARREQQARETRAGVLAAATEMFVTNGWTATGMRDIARAAGVAIETVYSHFPSKATLLRAAMDLLVVGDDVDAPLAARPEFTATGQGSRSERIAAAARLIADVNLRTAGIAAVLREAARSDEAMAVAVTEMRDRQREDIDRGLALILGRQPATETRDGVWAILSHELYSLLVDHAQWSRDQYESWIAATLAALLPEREGS